MDDRRRKASVGSRDRRSIFLSRSGMVTSCSASCRPVPIPGGGTWFRVRSAALHAGTENGGSRSRPQNSGERKQARETGDGVVGPLPGSAVRDAEQATGSALYEEH